MFSPALFPMNLPRVRRLPLVAALVLSAAAPAVAAPSIARIVPAGAPRGATVEVEITGSNLSDARELFFQDPGIVVEQFAAAGGRRVTATLRVAADCPTGPRKFRLRTRDGLSDLRTFRVGLLPQEPEVEPNDDPATAAAITTPRTIAGTVLADDVDCFRVRLAAGARIAAAIDGIRLDQEMFDPHLELVDARGFVIAACDDHPLLAQDAMLVATVPEAGDYVLRVRESTFGGNDGCVYLLHVGDFPVAHLAWPPAGPPGTDLEIEWLGDPVGSFSQRIRLPAATGLDGVAELHPRRDGTEGPVGVPLRVSSLAAVTEAEPNDTTEKATPGTAPAGLLGRLGATGDVDWFRIAASPGSKWHVRGWGRRLGSPIDLVLNIHAADEKRQRLTGNDDALGPDAVAEVTVPPDGAFLVRVNDHRQRGGAEFVYWIEVEPAAPEVMLSVSPGRNGTQEGLVAAVPRGNRTALVFNAARGNFGGPAHVSFAGLPAGVTATVVDAPGAATATLALFEAAPDAAEAVSMAAVHVAAAADGRPLGGLRQTTDLVVGQPNNAAYRAALDDRLPVAVVDAAPIRLDVEQPLVPITRRGSLDLRVKVERLDGREGRVRLTLPFRPPGIGGPSAVEIKEAATEATFPIAASPEAALGEWQVAMTAVFQPKETSRSEGERPVASRLLTLRVVEPLVVLAADPTTVEQGQEARIVWKVQKPAGFAGVAKARLMGLPARTEAPELELSADAAQLEFPVTVAADAPAGSHKNVFCEVRVPVGREWIVQATPPTQVRIDKPLHPAPTRGEAKP